MIASMKGTRDGESPGNKRFHNPINQRRKKHQHSSLATERCRAGGSRKNTRRSKPINEEKKLYRPGASHIVSLARHSIIWGTRQRGRHQSASYCAAGNARKRRAGASKISCTKKRPSTMKEVAKCAGCAGRTILRGVEVFSWGGKMFV